MKIRIRYSIGLVSMAPLSLSIIAMMTSLCTRRAQGSHAVSILHLRNALGQFVHRALNKMQMLAGEGHVRDTTELAVSNKSLRIPCNAVQSIGWRVKLQERNEPLQLAVEVLAVQIFKVEYKLWL